MIHWIIVLFVTVLAAFAPKTTTVTATYVTICEADVRLKANAGFKVHNTGSTKLSGCVIETWVGPGENDWTTLSSWVTCAALAAGAKTTWELAGNANEFLRVQAKTASGTTTTYCRPYGN